MVRGKPEDEFPVPEGEVHPTLFGSHAVQDRPDLQSPSAGGAGDAVDEGGHESAFSADIVAERVQQLREKLESARRSDSTAEVKRNLPEDQSAGRHREVGGLNPLRTIGRMAGALGAALVGGSRRGSPGSGPGPGMGADAVGGGEP